MTHSIASGKKQNQSRIHAKKRQYSWKYQFLLYQHKDSNIHSEYLRKKNKCVGISKVKSLPFHNTENSIEQMISSTEIRIQFDWLGRSCLRYYI